MAASKETQLLIVEDQATVREALKLALEDEFRITAASSAEEALQLFQDRSFAVTICDIGLPGMSGEALLLAVKASWPTTEVVMVTAARDVEQAVRCMKSGAYDYISKPWNVEELQAVVRRASEKWRLSNENAILRQANAAHLEPTILGSSEAMKSLRERISRVAAHDSTVLITGESGTGKELVARAIHAQSSRRKERFVAIACGSIPSDLVESELFGHEKGAFSSAYATRIGKFEHASGGTLFLDDVSTLPLGIQAKLLRVLQEREFSRLGSNRVIAVDVRVLSSTNEDLSALVSKGLFREDLYWRLCGVPVQLPPLREREDDVWELFQHFVAEVCGNHRRPVLAINETVQKALRSHRFPGNVRELKHLAETVVVLSDEEEIGVAALPMQLILQAKGRPLEQVPLKMAVHEFERQVILRTLKAADGNQSRAAGLLGIHRNTLLLKMAELNIPGRRSAEKWDRPAGLRSMP
jgi:DNA-binding NtrC family response regulator